MNQKAVRVSLLAMLVTLLCGCSDSSVGWPPPPRNPQEKLIVESALRAVAQIDGWPQTACVVEQRKGQWRVQAWRVVNSAARGRDQCVPWAVRGITLDRDGKVIAYENHL